MTYRKIINEQIKVASLTTSLTAMIFLKFVCISSLRGSNTLIRNSYYKFIISDSSIALVFFFLPALHNLSRENFTFLVNVGNWASVWRPYHAFSFCKIPSRTFSLARRLNVSEVVSEKRLTYC